MIYNLQAVSGAQYEIDTLKRDRQPYIDRDYRFLFVPDELNGLPLVKTCGNDKLLSEREPCFSFHSDTDVSVYVLFADKFPVVPSWLEQFDRLRLNVTRYDSNPENLKGYYSVYRRNFPKGIITLNGCSPDALLKQAWYIDSIVNNYCMYAVCVKEKEDDFTPRGISPEKTI